MNFKNENQLVILGETNFRSQRWRFGIKHDDRRRHMYVVGSTGMGKSEFLKNMAIQDIEAGRGVAFIDPHGDSVDDLLDHIPEDRIKDVVYFDPGDLEYPMAFNVMEGVDFDYRHLVASGLVGVFKKIWGVEAWSGRMEYILNNTILALLEYPGSTLLGINRLMSNKEYRKKVVESLKDPIVKSFWLEEFAKYADRFATEATAAIQNKVGQFSSNNLIRNIIGQPKTKLDIRAIMDEGKILLANVSRGKIGEDASRLLGAFLVTKIQLAAMSRVDIPEKERRDFYLYVDEFQHFATESFSNILSEARKYHLSLIMAHQYIKQMEEPVRDAVFGNVGTIVSFRVGAEDAEYLEKWFSPDFLLEDIVNLGKYHVYLKLMIDGVSSKGFSASMISPLPKLEKSNREAIIDYSRKHYATPRSEVEENISEWAGILANQAREAQLKESRAPARGEYDRTTRGEQGRSSYRDSNFSHGGYDRPQNRSYQDSARSDYDRYRTGPEYRKQDDFRSRHTQEDRQNYSSQTIPKPQVNTTNSSTPLAHDGYNKVQPNSSQQPKIEQKTLGWSKNEDTRSMRSEVKQQMHHQENIIPSPPSQSGSSLNEALKQGPISFRGKKIEHRREKQKVEVNTDELRKVLEEAMK